VLISSSTRSSVFPVCVPLGLTLGGPGHSDAGAS